MQRVRDENGSRFDLSWIASLRRSVLQRKTREGQALCECSGTTKLITMSAEDFFIHMRHVHVLAAGAGVDVGIDVVTIISIVAIKWCYVHVIIMWWRLRCLRLAYNCLAFGRRSLR
jgi:hypothetical protein